MQRPTVLGLLSLLGLFPGLITAEPQILYTKRTSFKMPVRMQEADRAVVQELQFHVRSPEGVWRCVEVAAPTQEFFTYQATGDGEYCFTFVTVDNDGKRFPADPAQASPGLIVIVDTQPPQGTLERFTLANGDPYLKCRVEDRYLDPESIDLAYQPEPGIWQPLERVSSSTPIYPFPPVDAIDRTVKLKARDWAGNQLEKEVRLPLSAGGSEVARVIALPSADQDMPTDRPDLVPPPPLPGGVSVSSEETALSQPEFQLPRFPSGTHEKETPVVPVAARMATPTRPDPDQPLLLHTPHFHLDYAIEDFLAKPGMEVNFYCSNDQGQTWQLFGRDHDATTPAQLTLPADGLYGIAARLAADAPLTPDKIEADAWVDIDTIAPVVELQPPSIHFDPKPPAMTIHWRSSDLHLGDRPIALWYARRQDGPWTLIAEQQPNSGSYRWVLPAELQEQVYLRIDATDLAGNLGRAVTAKPILLSDGPPRVRVLSITPARMPGAR